jgi:hypothetical protein
MENIMVREEAFINGRWIEQSPLVDVDTGLIFSDGKRLLELKPIHDLNGVTSEGRHWFSANLVDYMLCRLSSEEMRVMNSLTTIPDLMQEHAKAQETLFHQFFNEKLSEKDRADFKRQYLIGTDDDPYCARQSKPIVFGRYAKDNAVQLLRSYREGTSITGRINKAYRNVRQKIVQTFHCESIK